MSGPSSSSSSGPRLAGRELEERLDAVLFASPSHRSVEGLADALRCLTRAQQERVLHWAAVAARTCAEIGYLLASLAPRAFELLDEAGFDAWALSGLEAYDRQGLRPAMDRLRDLVSFRDARAGSARVRLSQVENRLAGFLRGLSGRALAVKAGARAWTDTETVFLPPELDHFGDANENRRLYKALAAMLWAQTRYGTFAIDLTERIASWEDRGRALAWLSALEAVRLHARLAIELPGLAAEIARLAGPWPASVDAARGRLSDRTAGVEDSVDMLGGFMAGAIDPPRLVIAGELDPEAAGRVRAQRIARETRVLRRILGSLEASAGRQATVKSVVTVDARAAAVPLELRIDGEAVRLPPEALAAARSLIEDLGELPPEALGAAGEGPWLPTARQGPGPEPAGECEDGPRYDEWDYHRQAYRRAWCHVREIDAAAGEADYVREVSSRHAPLIRQIRRRFEAVRGEDRMLGRQPDGEDIDIDALTDALADRRAGRGPAERVFRRRVRNERSLAALFMVDMSGSTKGWVNDAEREALILLCEGLETLGDAYAIYGFSGWTRTRCDIYRVKAFGERYDEAVRARIAGIEAMDYTRMGVAIRHLTGLLVRQAARHRLLVSLSDGRPDDFGDEYRGSYGIEDTRRALLEAHGRGVRSYCVTIDRHGAEYLAHMYGPAGYTVLDEVRKLPARLAEIYRRLTR